MAALNLELIPSHHGYSICVHIVPALGWPVTEVGLCQLDKSSGPFGW